MLHQVMVRVPREGEWVEPEGINYWLTQKPKVALDRFQVACIKGDKVVTDNELRSI